MISFEGKRGCYFLNSTRTSTPFCVAKKVPPVCQSFSGAAERSLKVRSICGTNLWISQRDICIFTVSKWIRVSFGAIGAGYRTFSCACVFGSIHGVFGRYEPEKSKISRNASKGTGSCDSLVTQASGCHLQRQPVTSDTSSFPLLDQLRKTQL